MRTASFAQNAIFFRYFIVLCLSFGFSGKLSAHPLPLELVSTSEPLIEKLNKRTTGVFEGRPLGDALREVAAQADVEIWVDRRVDPSSDTSAGQVGPTVYLAIKQIAETRECVIMPVRQRLLIGRPDWVDATTAALATVPEAALQPIAVRWPEATTPSEIVRTIFSKADIDAKPIDLPHDLWPANEWSAIDPAIAIALVLAQFDQRIDAAQFPKRVNAEPASKGERYAVKYTAGDATASVLAAIRQSDRMSQARTDRRSVIVTATATGHRAGIDRFLSEQTDELPSAVDLDTENLALNLLNTPAKQVFEKLAAAALRKCTIEPSAETACETLVSFETKKSSFRQLVAEVARQAGVSATWTNDSLIVSGD